MGILLLILGIILFIGLVIVHEWGHFIMARRNGVQVEEFAIGFPPKIWRKRMKSGFVLSFNWLPLGGFVRLKGEHEADKSAGSLGAASIPAKIKIMVAGVVMNLITAFVILTFLALVGLPKLIENQFTVASDTRITSNQVLVGFVEPGSPADRAGLEVRDELVAIAAGPRVDHVQSMEELPNITEKHAGKTVAITVERNGQQEQLVATLRDKLTVEASKDTDDPKGYLGVSPTEYTIRRSTWSAPIVAAGFMKQVTELTFKGLGSAISNLFQGEAAKASQQVSGPVGIFVVLRDGSLLGYQFVLLVIAVISLTPAISL